jgi:hypothetical protein
MKIDIKIENTRKINLPASMEHLLQKDKVFLFVKNIADKNKAFLL